MLPMFLGLLRYPDGLELVDDGLREPRLRNRTDRGDLTWIETVDLENPVALQFVNARSTEDLIAFHSRYGFRSPKHVEKVDGFDETPLSNAVEARDSLRTALAPALGDVPSERSSALNRILKPVKMTTTFELTSEGRGRMVFHPESLWQFMCVEVATAGMNDIALKSCANCENLFFTGPLAHRRADTKFCSDRCRVGAMRKRKAAAHP